MTLNPVYELVVCRPDRCSNAASEILTSSTLWAKPSDFGYAWAHLSMCVHVVGYVWNIPCACSVVSFIDLRVLVGATERVTCMCVWWLCVREPEWIFVSILQAPTLMTRLSGSDIIETWSATISQKPLSIHTALVGSPRTTAIVISLAQSANHETLMLVPLCAIAQQANLLGKQRTSKKENGLVKPSAVGNLLIIENFSNLYY